MIKHEHARIVTAFLLVTFTAILSIATLVGKSSGRYADGEYHVMYDGYVANPDHRDFTASSAITSNSTSYSVNFTASIALDDRVIEYIETLTMESKENLTTMHEYTNGTVNLAWISEKAVYEEKGGIERVYSIDSLLLMLLDGNATIQGNGYRLYLIMTTRSNTGVTPIVDQSVIAVIVLVSIISIAFFAYIFMFRAKRVIKKRVNEIKKSGRKIEGSRKKYEKGMKNET